MVPIPPPPPLGHYASGVGGYSRGAQGRESTSWWLTCPLLIDALNTPFVNLGETFEGASTHRAPAPRAPHALARYQESDYCTTFSGNNATQTPQKKVTRINTKHGNDRMSVVNQMSSVMRRIRSCSYTERRYIWTPMSGPRKDRQSMRCHSHHLSHH